MMRSSTTAAMLMGISFALAGCNLSQSSSPGGVAVLDLDKVGEKLGRLELISQGIDRYTQQQQTAYLQLQDKLRAQVATLKKGLGNNPSKKQLQELQQVTQTMESQLQAAMDQANQEVAQYRSAQIEAFRDEARPIAERAARARGLSLVMLRQGHYLWVDPAVDITQDVLDAMSDSH